MPLSVQATILRILIRGEVLLGSGAEPLMKGDSASSSSAILYGFSERCRRVPSPFEAKLDVLLIRL